MLVAVLRRPDGLFALSIERDGEFRPPSVSCELGSAGSYIERVRPLETGDASYAELRAKAWASLDDAGPDALSLAALLHLLVLTVPDPGSYDQSLGTPRLEPDPEPPARSAAHPRGFRGTKSQPPKPAQPGRISLRPYLDGGNHEAALLRQLGPFLEEATQDVERQAAYGSMLAEFGADALLPLGQCWPRAEAARLCGMHASFRRYFLWALRGMEGSGLSEAIAVFWGLQLDEDAGLRRIAAAMVCSSPVRNTLRWLRALEGLEPERRYAFAELLLETHAYWQDADAAAEVLARYELLYQPVGYRHRTHFLLAGMWSGMEPTYILDGFELANQFWPRQDFVGHGEASQALSGVRRAMSVISGCEEDWARTGFALVLWQRCGQLDGFGQLLTELDWEELGPESSYRLARLLAETVHSDVEDEELAEKWDCVRQHAGQLYALLLQTPPGHGEKARAHLSEVLGMWDYPEGLEATLRRYFQLMPRLCSSPFGQAAVGCDALSSLTLLDEAHWQAVQGAPDDAFRRFEKECRRANNSRLLWLGLYPLAKKLPALTARSFAARTGILLDVARTLGCGLSENRHAVLDRVKKSVLFLTDPEGLAAGDLVALVDSSGTETQNLITRRLRQHLAGSQSLSASQVERDRRIILDHWDEVLLKRVEAAALEQVSEGLGLTEVPREGNARHALLFQSWAYEHRRAIRKLLKAHLSGDRSYLEQHPLNQAWFAAHPKLDRDLWLHGVELRLNSANHGQVSLSIERDPLEVLRMGTYVGTCLSIGGGQSYSAAAITLDANKQVIYCRNQRGKVLARQLLAFSKKELLFCFEVYPLDVSDEIKQLFLEFDQTFAAALEVPIHDPKRDEEACDEYEIAHLLSRAWWFDEAIQVPPQAAADAHPSEGQSPALDT